MQKIRPLLLFFLLGKLLFAQEKASDLAIDQSIKQAEHPTVTIQNAFHINSQQFEFSPTYYQNGIVYVKDAAGAKIDGNIGIPFFELFYAELDGEGMPSNPQPFSTKVNSTTHEGPLAFNFTEDLLFFTSNSDKKNAQGKKTMKIFQAQKGSEEWENRLELPFNGEEFHTMHPSLSATGTKLYFASNRLGGFGGTDIYYVENTGNGWGTPINLGATVNTPKNEAFPFIHESGMLFFASEGHAGMGGYDIYAVNTFEENTTEIIHLGAPFNSANADFGLVLNPTGAQGYFTSARLGGMGQDDIYLFDAPDGLFSEAAPTKSTANILVIKEKDGATIPNAGVYVFEKNENGLFGEDDLYEVVLAAKEDDFEEMEVRFVMKKELGAPHFYTNEEGRIQTELTNQQDYLFLVTKKGFANKEVQFSTIDQPDPMKIAIPMSTKTCVTLSGVVRDEKTGAVVPNTQLSITSGCKDNPKTVFTDAAGKYELCLPFGCDYTILAQKTGFVQQGLTVSTKNLSQSELSQDINLIEQVQPEFAGNVLSEGSTIVLENIYYDFNKSAIRAGAAEELDALVTLMLQYPSMEVELTAHTDARGKNSYNRALSRERAHSAKAYLSRKGINPARIQAFGMGEVAIRNHCINGVKCSDEEHQYNRRTEVRVTKLAEKVDVRYSGK
ncbi:MAG: OmpA family protein [Bacteroidota bacterium]